mgnify:FL=1
MRPSQSVIRWGEILYFAPDVRRRWAWFTPGSIAATLL